MKKANVSIDLSESFVGLCAAEVLSTNQFTRWPSLTQLLCGLSNKLSKKSISLSL